jgi:streptogramin lyase
MQPDLKLISNLEGTAATQQSRSTDLHRRNRRSNQATAGVVACVHVGSAGSRGSGVSRRAVAGAGTRPFPVRASEDGRLWSATEVAGMLGRIEVDARLATAAPLVVERRVDTAGRRLAG